MDESKRQWVQLWLSKASSDLRTVMILARTQDAPLDTAVYHCQQAAEKALKGYLAYVDQPVHRTHDVEDLVQKAIGVDATFAALLADATIVKPYATGFRYPSIDLPLEPELADLDEAFVAARRIYDFVLSLLPPETHPA